MQSELTESKAKVTRRRTILVPLLDESRGRSVTLLKIRKGELDGTTVTCPCHGSQFDVTSGAVLRGPA